MELHGKFITPLHLSKVHDTILHIHIGQARKLRIQIDTRLNYIARVEFIGITFRVCLVKVIQVASSVFTHLVTLQVQQSWDGGVGKSKSCIYGGVLSTHSHPHTHTHTSIAHRYVYSVTRQSINFLFVSHIINKCMLSDCSLMKLLIPRKFQTFDYIATAKYVNPWNRTCRTRRYLWFQIV